MKEIDIAIQSGVVPLIWGGVGIGKTAYIESLADVLGWRCYTFVGSVHEPTDLTGIPYHEAGKTKFAIPEFIDELNSHDSLLFLDELTCNSGDMMRAMLRLIRERYAGPHKLSSCVRIVAAANPPDVAVYGAELDPPMKNRMCHIYFKPSASIWTEGLINGFRTEHVLLPPNWRERIPLLRYQIAQFIRVRPKLLYAPDFSSNAFPSPRSWEMASYVVAAADAIEDLEAAYTLCAGCVGEGAATEFFTYREKDRLPSIDELLDSPHIIKTLRLDQVTAISQAVVEYFVGRGTPEAWQNAWKIVIGIAAEHGFDTVFCSARELAKMKKAEYKIPGELKNFAGVLL